ncbi:hypothetical protein C5615_38285 [Burkholderia cepacia]|uniref:Uncharacterized protein n=1 Tax=Burkholderia cepacia TaxID=292 RepID=A0A2S8HWG5_BURCE|nr:MULTISPECIES: hypothetical protein [Burkholderia]PQP06906.1 hypothetical protein C5615_38285 [Burkholderia cepacia]HDR9512183.1 hypothetical protein [Burkholderia cepacia]
MTPSLNDQAYKVISEFLGALNSMDKHLLESTFGVTEPILDEICESLDDYFGRKPSISLAPIEVAFSGKKGSRPYIDLFEMDDGQSWGAECILWVDGKAQEPILHVELSGKGDDLNLKYKYIGS